MLIDLTCPAELFRTVLPTEKTPAALLTLFNLSDRVIASVEVRLCLIDVNGAEMEQLSFRGRSLNGRPHSTFQMRVPCAGKGVRAVEASIEKVWFADHEVWRRDPARAVDYEPNALPISPALTRLKYAAGENAVGYPSLQPGLWVCVCGRPNPAEADQCARCGQLRDNVFSRFTPEAVKAQVSLRERQLDLSSRSMREDTIRLQRLREEAWQAGKARNRSRLLLAGGWLLALLLCAALVFFGAPQLRLFSGKRALAAGDYLAAKSTFLALGDFGDAPALAGECDWRLALQKAGESDSAEALAEASALLRSVSDRPEAREKADETDLLRARLLISQGSWKEAAEILKTLPEDYGDRSELLQRCLLAQARELIDRKAYGEAEALLKPLATDLPEARELLSECVYQPALALLEAEDWDGALEALSRISGYRDSRSLILRCHFEKAVLLESAGDKEGAVGEYLMAEGWEDAAAQMKRLTYDLAEEKIAQGDLSEARILFDSIPDYEDAPARALALRYQLAKNAVSNREYTRALELLENVPDDYEKTRSLRAEAAYEKARIALRQEDWALAAELLGGLDRQALKSRYRDIENLYLQACREAGLDPYPTTAEPETTDTLSEEGTPTPPEETASISPEPSASPDPSASPNSFLVTEDD